METMKKDYLKKASEIDREITEAIAKALELNEELFNSGEIAEGSEAWKSYCNVEHNFNNALSLATRACNVLELQARGITPNREGVLSILKPITEQYE